jgi:hypothetical protein
MESPDSETDRTALVMNVCPFGNEYPHDEFRGIRTKQYSYICSPEGAIMMFDNIKDPYQMDNLVENDGYTSLQKKLDKKLSKALKKIGDKNFKSREYYLEKWNLKLNDGKVIDYNAFRQGDGVVQSPGLSQ